MLRDGDKLPLGGGKLPRRERWVMFAEVAVPVPLRKEFTYRIPEDLRSQVRPGSLVQVPFGRRIMDGFVLKVESTTPRGEVKDIAAVQEEELSIPQETLDLCRWVSTYYLAPLGEVLRGALPAGLGKRSPDPIVPSKGQPPEISLSKEQEAALTAINEAVRDGRPGSFLLYGVTGSGKTEVYLRAAEHAVSQGGKALILIPEIALSPQMVGRVEARFGNKVALWHSALAPSERRRTWARTRRGEIDVLVGARSAVFAPLPDLKLIVVDEEHEGAYKQTESPRYHARDVALVRAMQAKAVTVLGSATPSLESFANAEKGKHRLLTLPHRVEGRPRGRVECVPLPRPTADEPSVSRIFSDPLREAMADTLSRKEQCILLLNRRGHSTVVQCDPERHVLRCSQCDIALTWHSVGDHVVCHYCGRRRKRPEACPTCGNLLAVFKGVGTQQVAAEVSRLFGEVRVLRMDTDSMRKRGALQEALDTFRRGEADVLLGTQMVAKGLDFPSVTLVGVINADLQLALPDFRSAERSFQLLTQVAGRSGRGDKPGKVLFQTDHGEHYAVVAAAEQDYEMFYREELAARRDPAYPPHVRLVNIMFDGRDEDRVIREAEAAAEFLDERIRTLMAVEYLGPAPQPFSRLKGRFRWHVTLRGRDHHVLRKLADDLLSRPQAAPARMVRAAVDVDPVSLL